jgi:hypothetical protein
LATDALKTPTGVTPASGGMTVWVNVRPFGAIA